MIGNLVAIHCLGVGHCCCTSQGRRHRSRSARAIGVGHLFCREIKWDKNGASIRRIRGLDARSSSVNITHEMCYVIGKRCGEILGGSRDVLNAVSVVAKGMLLHNNLTGPIIVINSVLDNETTL